MVNLFRIAKTLAETPEQAKSRKQREKEEAIAKKKAEDKAWEEVFFQEMMDED